jgi:hypothetical protein
MFHDVSGPGWRGGDCGDSAETRSPEDEFLERVTVAAFYDFEACHEVKTAGYELPDMEKPPEGLSIRRVVQGIEARLLRMMINDDFFRIFGVFTLEIGRAC